MIEYGYDSAGRIISTERKPDDLATSHGERTFLTLNNNGQKIKEELQSWSGSGWTTVEPNGLAILHPLPCGQDHHRAAGRGGVTEMAYDCDGNLEKVRDENHPSAGRTATPSTSLHL